MAFFAFATGNAQDSITSVGGWSFERVKQLLMTLDGFE
jgi:hypothetical protein